MNPLIFIPSPRDIPAVKKRWHEIPYDKFIVKYRPQIDAYTEGREFFLNHEEYTHLIMAPDDLEITKEGIEQLIEDVEKYDFKIISGICNIDESQRYVYAIQPIGCDFSRPVPTHKGSWYSQYDKPVLPVDDIFQVGHSGFCCEIIERSVMEKVSWVGSTNDKKGNFDWQFSHDVTDMNIPIMVDKRVNLYHRRFEQSYQAKKIRNSDDNIGYSVWIRDR